MSYEQVRLGARPHIPAEVAPSVLTLRPWVKVLARNENTSPCFPLFSLVGRHYSGLPLDTADSPPSKKTHFHQAAPSSREDRPRTFCLTLLCVTSFVTRCGQDTGTDPVSPLIGPHATVLASDWPTASQGQLPVTQHGASGTYYLLV